MLKREKGLTVADMRTSVDVINQFGGDIKEEKLYGSMLIADGIKCSAELHIFKGTANGTFTYWILVKGLECKLHFEGKSEEELAKDIAKHFTGVTKSDKEYHMTEWGMTEETWNAWNGIEE